MSWSGEGCHLVAKRENLLQEHCLLQEPLPSRFHRGSLLFSSPCASWASPLTKSPKTKVERTLKKSLLKQSLRREMKWKRKEGMWASLPPWQPQEPPQVSWFYKTGATKALGDQVTGLESPLSHGKALSSDKLSSSSHTLFLQISYHFFPPPQAGKV